MTIDADDLPASKLQQLLRDEWSHLTTAEQQLLEKALHRLTLPLSVDHEQQRRRTLGERAADGIASFGGSWTFVLLFLGALVAWIVVNTELLGPRKEAFDPYPFIFLNLILSMLAAFQAPIIMMSQNRQTARDRIDAEIDHQVNVRAELAIRNLDQRMHAVEQLHAEVAKILQQLATRK